ncbi:hypothetical protein O4215_20500 [Rhodococcus maanshanensis]|uniref:hypothetical protein n=1 Tax=Rhodococcus maanshanensis TaxID=183556 RepID=UPI0022B320FD|nr:hypothetical protein [Rhodococcus maanshanensis]MCZ4557945.1 hypothetical protein [Rhodococcus maanshanensis]
MTDQPRTKSSTAATLLEHHLAAHLVHTVTEVTELPYSQRPGPDGYLIDCTCGAAIHCPQADLDGAPTDSTAGALAYAIRRHQAEAFAADGRVVVLRPDASNPSPALIEAAYIAQDDLSTPPPPWMIRATAEIVDAYIAGQGHDVVHVLGHAAAVAAAEASR